LGVGPYKTETYLILRQPANLRPTLHESVYENASAAPFLRSHRAFYRR